MGFNPRILAFLCLIGIFVAIAYGGQFLFPNKHKEKDLEKPTMVVIEEQVTVLVTPTPDGHTYYASEYQNGTRLIQRPFSFIRYDALGTQDMKVSTIVYDYQIFEVLHWFNPATYKYVEARPANGDDEFILVYIRVFMDDIAGDDTRMWLFNRSSFAVFDENKSVIYYPKEYPYQLRFKEIETKPTFDGATFVQAFKSLREYSNSADNRVYAGEYNDEQYYLRGGASNAIDGFLIFEIPKKTKQEDLLVLAQLHAFGNAQWRLKA